MVKGSDIMEKIKLRNCPFCGGDAGIAVADNGENWRVIIKCNDCSANVQTKIAGDYSADIHGITYIRLSDIINAAFENIDKWNGCTAERKINDKFEKFREHIDNHLKEHSRKTETVSIIPPEAYKDIYTAGFLGGLEYFLRITDDEDTEDDNEYD